MVEVAGDVASKLEWEDWPVEVEAAVEGAEKVADALGWDGDPELVDVSVVVVVVVVLLLEDVSTENNKR